MEKIRYAAFFRALSLFGVFTLGGLAGLGWLAYALEGFELGFWLVWPLLGIGLYWLLALALAPQEVAFFTDRLTLRRWVGVHTILYDQIKGVSQSSAFITLTTHQGRVHLHKLFANDDAKLFLAFETYVPVARQARAHRLRGKLPITFQGKLAAPIFTSTAGLVLLAVGVSVGWYAFLQPTPANWVEGIAMLIFGLLSASLGALFLYLVLWTYPRRTIFTTTHLTQYFLVRTSVQPLTGLVAVQPGYKTQMVRGIPRRLYHIQFIYQDGTEYIWVPNAFQFPIDYLEAVEANLVNEWVGRLRQAYLTPSPTSAAPAKRPVDAEKR